MLFVSCAASGLELLDDSDADSHYQAILAELTDSDAISEVSGDSYSSYKPQSDNGQELVRIMEQNEDGNVIQRQQQLAAQPEPQSRRQRGMVYVIFCLLISAVDILHFRTVHSCSSKINKNSI